MEHVHFTGRDGNLHERQAVFGPPSPEEGVFLLLAPGGPLLQSVRLLKSSFLKVTKAGLLLTLQLLLATVEMLRVKSVKSNRCVMTSLGSTSSAISCLKSFCVASLVIGGSALQKCGWTSTRASRTSQPCHRSSWSPQSKTVSCARSVRAFRRRVEAP